MNCLVTKIKQQIDVTDEINELIKCLNNKGVLKFEVKAKRDVMRELESVLNMISLTK